MSPTPSTPQYAFGQPTNYLTEKHPANMEDDEQYGFHPYPKRRNMQPSPERQRAAPAITRRKFLTIRATPHNFHVENFRSISDTLFVPMGSDVVINPRRYDQFTFEVVKFHVGDANGSWQSCHFGDVMHCWRYDPEFEDVEKKIRRGLYIAYSLAFADRIEFSKVYEFVTNM